MSHSCLPGAGRRAYRPSLAWRRSNALKEDPLRRVKSRYADRRDGPLLQQVELDLTITRPDATRFRLPSNARLTQQRYPPGRDIRLAQINACRR